MSWFLDQFVNAVLQLCIAFVAFMTNQLVQPLGLSPDVILTYFPSITDFIQAFKILGIFLTIIIVLFQLIRTIFGSTSYGDKDNPLILILRSGLAIALILNSMSMMSYVFDVFSQPFYVLEGESGEKAFDVTDDEGSVFRRSVEEGFSDFFESAEAVSDEDYTDATTRVKDWVFPGITILKALIEIICILLIGYKFVMFLLEILQRYLMIMLQAFTSPLIWPCLSSVTTVGIFKKWFEMFISNFLLVYLNMWFLGLIVKSMSTVFNPDTTLLSGLGWQPNFFLGSCLIYAMLKIAQEMDTILSKLLETALSGGRLAQEIIMSLRVFQNAFHRGRQFSFPEGGDDFYTVGENGPDIVPPGPQTYYEAEGTHEETKESYSGKETLDPALAEAVEPNPELNVDDAFIPKTITGDEFSYIYGIDQEELENVLGEEPQRIYREDDGTLLVEGQNKEMRLIPVSEATAEDGNFSRYQKLISSADQRYLVLPQAESGGALLSGPESYEVVSDLIPGVDTKALDYVEEPLSLPESEGYERDQDVLPQYQEVK